MYSQEEGLAFCAGQCQASRAPVYYCRCICRGENHGILHRQNRVYDAQTIPYPRAYGYAPPPPPPQYLSAPLYLPAIEQAKTVWKDQERKGDRVEIRNGKARLKTFKKVLKTVTGYRTSDDLNNRILNGLHGQFNQERIDAIVDQAFSVFYSRVGSDANRPELYELYENGDIDRALSLFNVRWVIGRPKKN